MIETAQSHHLKQLVQLNYEYWSISPMRDYVEFDYEVCMDFVRRAMILPTYNLVVYTDDRYQVQGGALAYLSPYAFNTKLRCNLEYIFVRPEYRRTDCARDLVTAQEQWAKSHNVIEMATGDIGFNPEHISKWYESQGYSYTGACLTKRLS